MFFKKIILIKISGKNINNFIKKIYNHKINIYKIKIKKDEAYLTIDDKAYDEIDKIKTYYSLCFIDYLGYKKIFKNIIEKKIYYLFLLCALLIVFFLSRITFEISIITNNSKMRDFFIEELAKNGIKKYSFLKKYDEISKIKNNILANYKDIIEWLEIERCGTSYIVRYELKLHNEIKNDNKVYDIVAKKNARILKLDISDGQILKNINEYVNINDMIVSSDIKLFDEVKNINSAKGNVYGEVWYKVNIKYPTNYYEEIKTNNYFKTYSLTFLNKHFLFKKNNYKYYRNDKSEIIKNNLLPISFNLEIINELEIINSDDYQNKALEYCLNKIKNKLNNDEYILDYYILSENTHDKIYEIDVFVSTFENIGIYKERINEDEGNI